MLFVSDLGTRLSVLFSIGAYVRARAGCVCMCVCVYVCMCAFLCERVHVHMGMSVCFCVHMCNTCIGFHCTVFGPLLLGIRLDSGWPDSLHINSRHFSSHSPRPIS